MKPNRSRNEPDKMETPKSPIDTDTVPEMPVEVTL